MTPPPGRGLRRVVLGAVVLAILSVTLTPAGASEETSSCFFCGERATADFLRNIVLFVPLGAALAVNGWRARRALPAAALLSIAIELIQRVLPGREASVSDVLGNSSGAVLGFLAMQSAGFWLKPPPRRAAGLAVLAAAVATLVLVATTVLLRPSLPRSRYFGQWTPVLGHLVRYLGRVDEASIQRLELVTWELDSSAAVRTALLAGAPLHVRGIAGPSTSGLASIFSIADDAPREILLIGADRGDLVLRYRTRAAALKLDQPYVRLPGALRAIPAGAPLDIVVEQVGPHACITLNGRRACPRIGAPQGWAFFGYPSRLTPPMRRMGDVAWVAMLALPACYWALLALRGRDELRGPRATQ